MNKLPFTCEHRNITYKEYWASDDSMPEVFAVKCVECGKQMPESYRKLISERLIETYRMYGNKSPFVKLNDLVKN